MELKKIRGFVKTYKRPVTCIRILLLYLIFLSVATYTPVFDYGITKGKVNALISMLVMFYRFLSFSFVPGILAIWLFEIAKSRKTSA